MIAQISYGPRGPSGKKLEVPAEKLLLGGDTDEAVHRDSMANPVGFDVLIAFARTRPADQGT